MLDNIFDKLGNLLKGGKPKAEPAPAPQPAAKPEKAKSLGKITLDEIDNELKELNKPALSLREMLDTVSARMISVGREPYVSTGQQLQLYRRGLTTAESPFLDYDEALADAVDQLEHYCALENDAARVKAVDSALNWLTNAFNARSAGTPANHREVLELKCHYLRMQLITQQGQLFNSQKRLQKYRNLKERYERNPSLDPNGLHLAFVKKMIEETEQREKVLKDNIGNLQDASVATETEIGSAPLVSINPSEILSSVVRSMAEDNIAYQLYLRQMSDFIGLLKQLDDGLQEIKAQELATEKYVQAELYKLELNRQMRDRMASLMKPVAPSPAPIAEETAAPVENAPAPSVEKVEEPAEAPIEAIIF